MMTKVLVELLKMMTNGQMVEETLSKVLWKTTRTLELERELYSNLLVVIDGQTCL